MAWNKCLLDTTSGREPTSCSDPGTIAQVTRKKGRTTSTWTKVSTGHVLLPANPEAASPFFPQLSLFFFPYLGDAAAFDDEWRRETSRFRPQRGLDYRRHEGTGGRRAEGTRLAIQGPEDSPSRQSRRYDW